MVTLLLGASALFPSLLLVTYFHRRDVFPEPAAVLWRTFGLGVLIVFPVCLVAWQLDALAEQLTHPLAYGFASAFLGAAIPEEFFKFVVLYFYAARHMEFDEPMDGVVYGATASLGFAALENVLYVVDGGFGVAAVRAVLSVPGHALFGVVMGYFVGQAKFTEGDRTPLLARALGIPILLHGLYDAPLLAAAKIDDPTCSATGCISLLLLPLAPAIVLGGGIWTVRLVRRLRAEQLSKDVPLPPGTLPLNDFPALPALPALPPPPSPTAFHVGAMTDARAHAAQGSQAPGKVLSWVLTLFGGILACGGALVTFLLIIGLMIEEGSSEEFLDVALGGLVLGVLPLLVGTLSFLGGIRRLNREQDSLP